MVDIKSEISEELHGLTQQCNAFRDRVSQFVNSHKRNRKTLQYHMQLVELLEVPQLVDACTRNGFHEEALELANFVNGLERKHLLASEVRSSDGRKGGPNVVQSIVHEVHIILSSLRQQILQSLSENVSLPKQIQHLAILRKLEGLLLDRQIALERFQNEIFISMNELQKESFRSQLMKCIETRLQMDYLEARSLWLDNLSIKALRGDPVSMGVISANVSTSEESKSVTVDGSDPHPNTTNRMQGHYGKLIEMLEVNRTSWFSVVTHFNALFEDATGAYPAHLIISTWAANKVQQLLSTVSSLLPSIEDGASMRSVLEQMQFFATRMSQVGCDFSCLIIPVFSNSIVCRLHKDWSLALSSFKRMLTSERYGMESESSVVRDQVVPLYLPQQLLSGLEISSTSATAVTSSPSTPQRVKGGAGDEVLPPDILLNYPPLAYLCNVLLTGINFLRDCPLKACRENSFRELGVALTSACQMLVDLREEVRTKGCKYLDRASLHRKGVTGNVESTKDMSHNTDGEYLNTTQSSEHTEEDTLDVQYAKIAVHHLIPHILHCFEMVFPVSSSSSTSLSSPQKDLDHVRNQVFKTNNSHNASINGSLMEESHTVDNADANAQTIYKKCREILSMIGALDDALVCGDSLVDSSHISTAEIIDVPSVTLRTPSTSSAVSSVNPHHVTPSGSKSHRSVNSTTISQTSGERVEGNDKELR